MSVTLSIIIITCLVSFPAFSNEKMKEDLLFWPYAIKRDNQFYRFHFRWCDTCGHHAFIIQYGIAVFIWDRHWKVFYTRYCSMKKQSSCTLFYTWPPSFLPAFLISLNIKMTLITGHWVHPALFLPLFLRP